MPTRALDNPLVLPILGLLIEQPAHAYHLTSSLQSRYPHLGVQRSTVTTLVKSLSREGLISTGEPERSGNRPSRTPYTLTEAGVSNFRARVADQVRGANPGSVEFITAIAYVGILSAPDARAILTERAADLLGQRDALPAPAIGEHEIRMIEVEYWRSLLQMELDWLRALTARVDTADIEWSSAATRDTQPTARQK